MSWVVVLGGLCALLMAAEHRDYRTAMAGAAVTAAGVALYFARGVWGF